MQALCHAHCLLNSPQLMCGRAMENCILTSTLMFAVIASHQIVGLIRNAQVPWRELVSAARECVHELVDVFEIGFGAAESDGAEPPRKRAQLGRALGRRRKR